MTIPAGEAPTQQRSADVQNQRSSSRLKAVRDGLESEGRNAGGGGGGKSAPSARDIYEAGLQRQQQQRQQSQRGSRGMNGGGGGGGGGRGGGSPSRRSASTRGQQLGATGRSSSRGRVSNTGSNELGQEQAPPPSRRSGPPGRGNSVSSAMRQNSSARRPGMGNGAVEGGVPRYSSSRRGNNYNSSRDIESGGEDWKDKEGNKGRMNGTTMMSGRPPPPRKNLSRRESTMADDPFAEREGKALTWRSVNMTLAAGRNSKKNPKRQLLTDVWGEVPRKEITAVMGPSGAGKSSLLNILAGRARSRGRLSISADVRLDNYEVDPTKLSVRKQIAFVAQDDSLQVTSTPREAIRFSAKLRLPRSTTERDLDRLTRRMLQELGLEHCADTMVGGALIKGISGGERKRTSVGVELVTKPALVFLDEPTSGLDSFSAIQLVKSLKKVANAGSSVLFTIHQPASEIFNSFDHLILLNKGRVMYEGEVRDVPTFFADRGQPIPRLYNPSDWIMSVAQSVPVEELDAAGFFPQDERKTVDAFHVEEGDSKHDALGITRRESKIISAGDQRPVSMLTEIRMLFSREFKNLTRDKAAIGARLGLTSFLGMLIGVIFQGVGATDSSVMVNLQSHFGALIMVLMMSMFGTAQPALLAFPDERPVFLREYSTDHYSVLSYFCARLTMEAVVTFGQILLQVLITYFLIGFTMDFFLMLGAVYALAMASTAYAVLLGCSVEEPKLGQEMLPLLFVPQMLFAGFFVAPELIPSWLAWAQYLCSLTYGVRIVSVAEFSECNGDLRGQNNCDTMLSNIGANEDDVWWYWLVLVCIFAVARLAALIVLKRKATKFF